MERQRSPLWVLTLVLGTALPNCGRGSPTHDQDAPKPADDEKDVTEMPAPPAEPKVDKVEEPPGWLVVAVGEKLVRLEDAGAGPIEAGLESEVDDLWLDADNQVYALAGSALLRIDGRNATEVRRFTDEVSPVRSVVIDGDTLWIANDKAVGTHVDGAWMMTPLETLGLEGQDVRLAFDAHGVPWAVGSTGAAYRKSDAWTSVNMSVLPRETRFSNPQSGKRGGGSASSSVRRVSVNNGFRITRIGADNFDSALADPDRRLHFELLSVSSDGHAVAGTHECDLARVTPEPPTKIWKFSGQDYACETAHAIALDDRLRVWVASNAGLSVVADDRRVREFPAGSFSELDGTITHMVVVGNGPELP